MELETFLLADAAYAGENKLYVHGGGVTRITPPMLPWLHPQLAVVLIFRTFQPDYDRVQRLRLSLSAPDGVLAMPAFEQDIGPLVPTAAPLPGEESRVQVVLTVSPVPFSRPGLFRFDVEIDGEPAGGMDLPVAQPAIP